MHRHFASRLVDILGVDISAPTCQLLLYVMHRHFASRLVDILGVDISAPTRHNDIIIPTFQIWITFSPIADTAVPYYSIDAFRLNMLVLVFAIASVPFGFLASWLLDTLGLRLSVSFTQ